MRPFDQRFVEESVAALRGIAPDQKPLWGGMNPAQLFAHLTTAVRYSLGKERETPQEGGWFGRRIAAPLLLNGVIRIPKNQRAPKMYDAASPSGTLEELAAELHEFLQQYGSADFHPPAHPYLGDIGVQGWAKLHQIHLEHHLRQFGVAPRNYLKG